MINYNSKIFIKKKYCIIPSPLAVGYCLSIIISSGIKNKKIFFAGFDGFNESNSNIDESDQIFKLFKKILKGKKLFSLTPTKYSSLTN